MTSPPRALMLDPLTWSHVWSYEVECDVLARAGVELIVPTDAAEQAALVGRSDVIVSSGMEPVGADRIAAFERCVGILCYSAGMDHVDHEAAESAGIVVANLQANTVDVADHAIALMLAAHRHIPAMASMADRGEWDLRTTPEIWTIGRLADQVVGIIGAGGVGRAVASRARAFGMTTIATYHHEPEAPDPELPHRSLHELLSVADIVICCASLTPESRHLLDASTLALVKRGALLVNISRGGLIDESALVEALDDGRLRGAALDVRESEPPQRPDPLAGRTDVIQTPHMAGASSGSLRDVHEMAASGVIALLSNAGRLDASPQNASPKNTSPQNTSPQNGAKK